MNKNILNLIFPVFRKPYAVKIARMVWKQVITISIFEIFDNTIFIIHFKVFLF